MKHLSPAAARAAPLQGLLAAVALHALAAASLDAKTTPTLAPTTTDLDTGQPSMIDLTAKLGAIHEYARRDSAGPPIGQGLGKRRHVDGTDKAKNGGYHRRHEVALN